MAQLVAIVAGAKAFADGDFASGPAGSRVAPVQLRSGADRRDAMPAILVGLPASLGGSLGSRLRDQARLPTSCGAWPAAAQAPVESESDSANSRKLSALCDLRLLANVLNLF